MGGRDVFILKLDSSGQSLIYSTFLGGRGRDEGRGITVDANGYVYITGLTHSSDFPTTSDSFDDSYNGGYDAFLAKISIHGNSIIYSTYFGGSGDDSCKRVVVDSNGHAYIVGDTFSTDLPVTSNAFDKHFGGYYDAIVAVFDRDGRSLEYATYLGGVGWDAAWGLGVDSVGYIYVTGWTASADFPVTSGSFDGTYNGSRDIFITKLNPNESTLSYSTYFGGSGREENFDAVVDGEGHLYVNGWTGSDDFPTTSSAFDNSFNGGSYDTFIARFSLTGAPNNDDFDHATTIPASSSAFSRTYTQDTTNATTASDDPVFTCVSGRKYHTVWYRITPIVNGTLTLDTNGSNYDTVLAVWRGARGHLTSVGCDDDSGSGYQSRLQVDVHANTTYYIEIAGYGSDSAGNLILHVSFEPASSGGPSIFSYETDVTGFLPDSSYEVWSWAEDGRYLYLVGVKKNVSVALVTVDKSIRSVAHSTVKNINGVDGARVGLKWGRVYVVTYIIEHDGSCGSPVHWDFWRVNGNTWTHVYRTSHNEGGFIPYLVTTNSYLYAVGDYSPCGSWGTKVVRLDQNENARVWTSETFTNFYHNSVFAIQDRIYLIHDHWSAWKVYLESYPETTNTFFRDLTHVGDGIFPAYVTDGTNRVVFIGWGKTDEKVHAIINGQDRVVFERRSFMGQAWAASNGHFYGVFRERDAERWHVVEIRPASRTVILSGKTWSGRMVGTKFMPFGREDNPGFVLNRSDGRKILVTLKSPWNDGCTSEPQPLDIVLTVDRSGSMDGQPLRDAKKAAKSFLGYLDTSVDKAALVSFSGSARLDQGLTHNFDLVRAALDRLSAGGNTAIGDAIKKAADELGSSRHQSNAASVIILLSDGDNTAGSDPLQQAQAAKNQGIRIITIGLGDSVNETLLQQIASSRSDYYFAPDSSDLQAIYRSIAGSICRSAPPKLYMPTIMRSIGTGIVLGQVVNATNNHPIQNAQVCILDTTQCTRTDNQGRYIIRQVAVGHHRVRASANGYISITEEIQVQPGATATVNFALSPSLAQGEIRIVLSWGLNPRDLDSHLWLPAARPYHVYYANKGDCSVFPYACLDVDDTTSYGPETITIKQRFDGTYVYAVHHFAGSGSLATSSATVRVYDSSGLIREFHVPSGSGIWWYVFDMDGRTGRITSRNYITSSSPGPYTTIEPKKKALPVGK